MKKIEKLDYNTSVYPPHIPRLQTVIEKVQELIDAHNELTDIVDLLLKRDEENCLEKAKAELLETHTVKEHKCGHSCPIHPFLPPSDSEKEECNDGTCEHLPFQHEPPKEEPTTVKKSDMMHNGSRFCCDIENPCKKHAPVKEDDEECETCNWRESEIGYYSPCPAHNNEVQKTKEEPTKPYPCNCGSRGWNHSLDCAVQYCQPTTPEKELNLYCGKCGFIPKKRNDAEELKNHECKPTTPDERELSGFYQYPRNKIEPTTPEKKPGTTIEEMYMESLGDDLKAPPIEKLWSYVGAITRYLDEASGHTTPEKKRDWQSDREDYLIGKPKKECHYCGFNYQDPKYCSVSGRTADKHKFL